MKSLFILTLFPFVLSLVVKPAAPSYDGKAFNSSEKLDFSDLSVEDIKKYYNADELSSYKGDELKDALYKVISKDNYFIDYGSGSDSGVNKWYKITDRNWKISAPISPDTYKFKDDTKDNYYLYLAYYEDEANNDKNKAINSYVNGFKKDESIKAVDWENKLRPNSYIQEDKEHWWAKNHGFAPWDGTPCQGAGTDLHHLVAADHNTNSAAHNDLFYGEVVNHNSSTEKLCYYADGTSAISGWRGKDKFGNEVFEPTDEWKGNVARAILYMGVRYSSFKDVNTEAEPYLVITDNQNAKDNFISTNNLEEAADKNSNYLYHGIHKNLSTLLAWNKLDPVSEYEIHRNNLIYNNVQRNRNPFIDYPSWADRVYAPDKVEGEGVIDPNGGTDIPTQDNENSDIIIHLSDTYLTIIINIGEVVYEVPTLLVGLIAIILIVIVIVILIHINNKPLKNKPSKTRTSSTNKAKKTTSSSSKSTSSKTRKTTTSSQSSAKKNTKK